MSKVVIQKGWDVEHNRCAAMLYDQAFGEKLKVAIKDKAKRIQVLTASMQPAFGYAAIADGQLVGVAGFQTPDGALTGGMTLSGLIKTLGFFKGIWAGLIFSFFERQARPGELVMDGIVVNEGFRGSGLGSKLLECIKQEARSSQFETVRLDVIDSNPRAKKLYLSKGFEPTEHKQYRLLKHVIGFSGATTMVHHVDQHANTPEG